MVHGVNNSYTNHTYKASKNLSKKMHLQSLYHMEVIIIKSIKPLEKNHRVLSIEW